jgi:hypothetical protein
MLLAHEIARSQLRTTEKRLKRDYDLKMRSHTYEVGDFVYLLDTATVKGKCRKLSPSWKGPGLIVQKLSDHLYRVRTRKSVMLTNHDRMKKCEDRDVPRWLLKARESQDADKTLEAADLNATSNADPSRGVTFQPESLAKDIPPDSAASSGPTPGATVPPKRGRGRPRKTPRSAAPPRTEDPQVHCTCRKPDDGRLMIQCDRCDIWFHGRCVGVTVEEAQRLDEYVCPSCSSVSISLCRKWKPARSRAHRKRRPRCIPQGTEGGQDSGVTPRGRVSVPNPSWGGR